MEETIEPLEQSNQPDQSYISRVLLKRYKSIIDTAVEFKYGLNIIIGANGSGKTNFVEFLRLFLSYKFDEISENYSGNITASINSKIFHYHLYFTLSKVNNSPKLVPNFAEVLYIDGKPASSTFSEQSNSPSIILDKDWGNLYPFYVSYGVPENFQTIGNLGTLEYYISHDDESIVYVVNRLDVGFTLGLQILLEKIFVRNIQDFIIIDKQSFPKDLDLIPAGLKSALKKFTPIKDIRIPSNYTINNSNNNWKIDYVRFEFLINDQWLTWNQLSDGTKRIFYIITEITFANNIVLLEEPELGIHPHQLSKLMDFIKEQSEEKQIILTTHSPEVLNTLKMDELDRIIVARYDKEKGTQLSHLSEDDIEHARNYMKDELFLSDYWVMSGFETEEEEV